MVSWNGSAGCIPYCPNIVNLCIDFYDRERQLGRLYHSYTAGGFPFSSLFEAFGGMEALYDALCFPQASTEIRNFQVNRRKKKQKPELPKQRGREMKEVESFDQVTEHRGREATFLIQVKYRQNSSWQGEVTWVDGQKKEYFRSALELVRLIDSALEEKNNGNGVPG